MHSRAFLGISQPRTFLGMAGVPRLFDQYENSKVDCEVRSKELPTGSIGTSLQMEFSSSVFHLFAGLHYIFITLSCVGCFPAQRVHDVFLKWHIRHLPDAG